MDTSVKFWTAKSSKCIVTAALLSMLVQKTQFQGKIENNFCKKSKFGPDIFFLRGLVHNKLKLYVFKVDFMTNQLKLTVSKKCWFQSWKGSIIWTLLDLRQNQQHWGKIFCNSSSYWINPHKIRKYTEMYTTCTLNTH